MAGVAGFEPARADTKNRCLTAWPHPNNFYLQLDMNSRSLMQRRQI